MEKKLKFGDDEFTIRVEKEVLTERSSEWTITVIQ